MHLKELAKLTYCDPSTLRTYLGRAEFGRITIRRGVLIGVTPGHIQRIKDLMNERFKLRNKGK